MEITPSSNINNLLTEYPQLEKFLMELNPKYKKLKNPVLRRTVGRIATLKQVAAIGGFDTIELVNLLRKELGQEALDTDRSRLEDTIESAEKPQWAEKNPAIILDGKTLLDEGKNPLAEVKIAMNGIDAGETVLLETDFMPAPLIDTYRSQGMEVYCDELSDSKFHTFILKNA